MDRLRRVPDRLRRTALDPLAGYGGQLLGLCGLAVAQPLFDVLAPNPTFFEARSASPSQIVLLALLIVFALPAVLLLVVAAARAASADVADVVQAVLVGALVALITAEAMKKALDDRTWAVVAGAVVAGALVGYAYRRLRVARTFLTVLAPAPLVFLALFLFHSPTSRLVVSSARIDLADVRSGAPVTVVIFDEFSSGTLMNAAGRIDAARFPNFARLAGSSTWYRNATTVDPWTERAVPAILTGTLGDPDTAPVFASYPHSLYTLLGGSYAMNDHETLTELCPGELCGRRAAAPVPSDTSTLVSDSAVVFLHLVLPGSLERRLPSLNSRWGGFLDGERTTAANSQTLTADPTAVFDEFVESLRPSRRPTLSVVHLALPHVPWQFFPSGRRYLQRFELPPGLQPDETWGPDPWVTLQAYQRYVLQVGYVDRLLGELLRRLRRTGLYDRTLLVLAADHGISFHAGGGRRAVTASSVADVAFPPLFVKAPRQRRGRIADAPVRTIDVVPTIASLLAARVPWEMDGRPAGERRFRPDAVVSLERKRYLLRRLLREREQSVARQISLFGAGRRWGRVYAIAPAHRELLGRGAEEFPTDATTRRATLDDADRFADVDLRGPFSPGYVTGSMSGRGARAGETFAVAVNGRIRALTRTYASGSDTRFGALLPDSAFRRGANHVALYAVSTDARGVVLALLAETSGERFTLVEGAAGAEAIRGAGRLIEISPGTVSGRVDVAVLQGSFMRLAGWAVAFPSGRPHDRLLLFADGRPVASSASGVDRPDLGPWSRRSGFDFLVPVDALAQGSDPPRLQLFAVAGRTASELPIPLVRLPRRRS